LSEETLDGKEGLVSQKETNLEARGELVSTSIGISIPLPTVEESRPVCVALNDQYTDSAIRIPEDDLVTNTVKESTPDVHSEPVATHKISQGTMTHNKDSKGLKWGYPAPSVYQEAWIRIRASLKQVAHDEQIPLALDLVIHEFTERIKAMGKDERSLLTFEPTKQEDDDGRGMGLPTRRKKPRTKVVGGLLSPRRSNRGKRGPV